MNKIGVTAAGVVLSAVTAATQPPVSIGILRQDGHLVPVATIEGDRFRPLLASSTQRENTNVFTTAALSLAGTTWKVSRRSGDQIEVTALNRAMKEDHCSFEETWRTSFKGTPVPKMSADIEKVGIAVIGAETLQPEDVTALPDEPSRRIARIALATAADAEARRLADDAGLSQYFRKLSGQNVAVRKLFRHANAGVATYFFETSKDPLPFITSGWIVDSPDGAKLHDVHFAVIDDAYKEGNSGTVIGLALLGARTLWLMQWHGYESENHAIHEWPSGRVRLRTPGVGC